MIILLLHTEGVALTQDGHIVVADSSNYRLQVLTVEGAIVAAVGSRGSQPLQFHYTRDIAVDRNGRLFVTELWNHRVQVLNPDLSFSHCFGSGKEASLGNYLVHVGLLLIKMEWCTSVTLATTEFRNLHRGFVFGFFRS